jgi:F420H(2)-dependent quinone reductase
MLWLFKLFLATHVKFYQLSGGRFGGRMMGGDVLLLTTIGRKSNKKRTLPVMYLRDGENYLVAASAGGDSKNPGWYWNAAKGTHPVNIQVGSEKKAVTVTDAEGQQREEFYQRFADFSEQFAKYKEAADRDIPVLILTPQA